MNVLHVLCVILVALVNGAPVIEDNIVVVENVVDPNNPEFWDYQQPLGNIDYEKDPEEIPGLFEGDIAGIDRKTHEMWRVGLKFDIFPERKWKDGVIPYHISKKYTDPVMVDRIKTAARIISVFTCVKFVPWDNKTEDFLYIFPGRGCWSLVGREGGLQPLSLSPPRGRFKMCLGSVGKPIHEMMHAIGFFHEHSRPDRNEYITLNDENMIPGATRNFRKQQDDNVTTPFEYDYHSIMHYGSRFFSKNRQPTIIPKRKDVYIGQRFGLSKLDCLKINHLYGCLQKSAYHEKMYTDICRFLGL